MLLAAARQNKGDFFLENAVLVGSDLYRLTNITALLDSSTRLTNYYSPADEAVRAGGLFEGAGGVGVRVALRSAPFGLGRLLKHPRLLQEEIAGTRHTGDVLETRAGRVPWMSRSLAMQRYGPILELRRHRGAPTDRWLPGYVSVRNEMELRWKTPLPETFGKAYAPPR
jgi:hypothetical protein